MNLAEEIKSRVTMPDVLEAYGIPVSRRGRIPCPLHHGKDNNFSYSDKWFKCFVCGASGSVIDFVMGLHEIPFSEACVKLNYDLNLNLVSQARSPAPQAMERRRILAEREAKEALRAAQESEIRELCAMHRRLHQAKTFEAPVNSEDEPPEMFVLALQNIDWIKYRIDCLSKEMEERN